MKSWLRQRKSQGALETVFKIFILLVVVGVVVALFLSATGKLKELLGGGDVVSLIEAKTECDSKCTRNSADWDDFCLEKYRMDLNKDGKTNSEYKGSEVKNIGVCESNVKCFNIVRCELPNGEILNAPKCEEILTQSFSEETSNPEKIVEMVEEALDSGSCGPAGTPPEAYCLAFPDRCGTPEELPV